MGELVDSGFTTNPSFRKSDNDDDDDNRRRNPSPLISTSGGDGDYSYSSNSLLQKRILSKANPLLTINSIAMMINLHFPYSIKVADLGCASGHNTFLTMSEIVNTIIVLCQQRNQNPPEISCYLNDLPDNDFNTTFKLIPFFNKRVINNKGSCFVYGVPGSFYSRLFPRNSLHFVHSSCSLHWLSKVPQGLDNNTSGVYITSSSLPSTYKAYFNQFQTDFTTFLKMRSEEMVSNGRMVLTIIGRTTLHDPLYRDCCHFWTLLSQSLRDLVSQGIVSSKKVDTFNMPFYDPSKEELKEIIGKEGSFEINEMESHGFDLAQSNNKEGCTKVEGEEEAKCIRAVTETMLAAHFGDHIIDALFQKFAYHASQHTTCVTKTTVTLIFSLIRT